MQTIIKHTSGFITRVLNGDLTNREQLIIFCVLMSVMGLFVALFGHAYQGYYYDNN